MSAVPCKSLGWLLGDGMCKEREPAIEPTLLELDNVVLAPHLGSATREGRIAMGEKVIVNIKSFVDHHRPPDRVYEI